MRIVLKPMGALLLVVTVAVLAVIAFGGRDRRRATESGRISVSRAPAAVETIYDDTMGDEWEAPGWSWAKDVDYASHKAAHSGTASVRARLAPYEGIKLHRKAPVDLGRFDRVAFYIRAGGNGVKYLNLKCGLDGKQVGPGVELPSLPPGQWVAVTLPISQFHIFPGTQVNEVWFQSYCGSQEVHFYLDDVRLLGGAAPDLPGSLSSAALKATPQ